MRIVHICWGTESTNGAANIARMIMSGQTAAGHVVSLSSRLSRREIRAADEVWCHCGWYYGIWWTVFWAHRFGKHICWVPECCYDPLRLKYHGWKKFLAGPVERFFLRRATKVLATCAAESEWVRAYEPQVKSVEVLDVKRYFRFPSANVVQPRIGGELHVLYLGRCHPLKGVEYLERAVAACGREVALRLVSDAQGDEKESVWAWCDVLCLPTLSDNFGLVVAEALERGKFVITTDGAPAWLDLESPQGICLKGYRNGTTERRVALLKAALETVLWRTRRAAEVCVDAPHKSLDSKF